MADSKWLLDGADNSLRRHFSSIRDLKFNQNTKGGNYEKIISEYLGSYFENLVDFHERTGIIDYDLKVLNLFTPGENEFDVVATFKTASPKIVLKEDNISFVPLDAVAYLIEVKQTLKKDVLESDLEKLKRASELPLSNRFRSKLGPVTRVEFPLRILFYYDDEISQETLENLLVEYTDSWDILIIYKDDRMYANSHLPFIERAQHILKGEKQRFSRFNEYTLIQFIIILQSSLTYSHYVDTLPVFYKLLRDNPPETS